MSYINTLNSINIALSAVFIFEAILKIMAFGKSYFKHNPNLFDFMNVFLSILDIIIEISDFSALEDLKKAP